MAIKKSELYSSLWASCDALRGGMDASQYKDYVLVLLFIKYISDKYAGVPYAPITVPKGASFKDMVALKGKSDIGDQINKKIIAPLANANNLSDFPDFNDATKLGTGKEMVERLTDLIAIFENPALNFAKNRAQDDDILGDAYEYLMRHFATESGKSKGQFYTPSEVSRIMAQILGIHEAKTSPKTAIYDPTCGSGSLLLKVADEARTKVTLEGQEKDAATSGLARMNMILHDNAAARIVQGNTLADPKFKDGDALRTYDYVVANPPFSDKRWSTGVDTEKDPYERFKHYGVPPAKQGDYAYLLHIVRSLKSTGKGACILPHGVLFRGNAEADIRRALVRKGYIKGIIGLPANLFYGTGIPACIVIIDKEEAHARKGIFMIDASQGYLKDGPKNRLRSQDIHKIVDAFKRQIEIRKYSRMVPVEEIEKNEFNLNLPRYIDSRIPEDRQDIEGHLKGGIPVAAIDALKCYWEVCPGLRKALFRSNRPGYLDLAIDKISIKSSVYKHKEFAAFIDAMNTHFNLWRKKSAATLKALKAGCHPKQIIGELSESLLAHYQDKPLIDAYDIYQHLMDYWATTMQDDAYLIAADGWKAKTYRIKETDKKGKEKDKGWACDLIPKSLIVVRYYAKEQAAIDQLTVELESVSAKLIELEKEHGGEDGAFSELHKVNKANVTARLKEIKGQINKDAEARDEAAVLNSWLKLNAKESDLKKQVKDAEADLDAKAYARYPKLTEAEIKALVVDDKWLATLDAAIRGEMDRVSRALTQRVKDLAERYETPLPQMASRVAKLEARVNRHLQGAMQELLTGKKRLRGFSGKWEVKRLGETAILKARIGWQGLTTAEYLDTGDYYLVTGTEFKNGYVDWDSCHYVDESRYRQDKYIQLKPFDVLVTKDGTIGKVALITELPCPATLNSGVFVIRPIGEAFHPVFFYYLLCSVVFTEFLAQLSAGSTINHLYQKDFVSFLYRTPATIKEQAAIAAMLSDMDAEITALEAKLAKARSLKQGMMQELLTGRIRLVKPPRVSGH